MSSEPRNASGLTLRVLLADDHEVMRHGLKLLIDAEPDMEVVGEAGDGRETLERYALLRPDVLVLDLSMPNLNGIAATEKLKRSFPQARVLVLTAYGDAVYLRQMLSAGAAGYVLKTATREVMLAAIRAVAQGGMYLDASVAGKVAPALGERKAVRGQREGMELSEREIDVSRKVAHGYTNKQIAEMLNISVKTVETHKANIMEKLGLSNRADFVRFAVHQGWMDEV